MSKNGGFQYTWNKSRMASIIQPPSNSAFLRMNNSLYNFGVDYKFTCKDAET